jgi:hypothetical protein
MELSQKQFIKRKGELGHQCKAWRRILVYATSGRNMVEFLGDVRL